MSSIFPGHEDLKIAPLYDMSGEQIFVTTGDNIYYPLMMEPTGNLRLALPARSFKEVREDGQSQLRGQER